MVIDGRSIASGDVVETDVCIIGSGAAGITVALELARRQFRVCLVESGGTEPEARYASLNEGEIVGHAYRSLDACRLRYFGGTTNHWGGQSRPLAPIAFEDRDWIPFGGWPFTRAELDPYYRRAQEICGLGPFAYEHSAWRPDSAVSPLDPGRLEVGVFQRKATRFGTVYWSDLTGASNVRMLLHSTVVELELESGDSHVRHARVATFARNEFRIAARIFVLATGGISNAQLLLASRSVRSAGIGNADGWVGTCFMEHLSLPVPHSFVRQDDALDLAAFTFADRHGTDVMDAIFPAAALQRTEHLPNFFVTFRPSLPETPEGFSALISLWRGLRRDERRQFRRDLRRVLRQPGDVVRGIWQRLRREQPSEADVLWVVEQIPDAKNRVVLARERDALGIPRVRLEWEPRPIDLENFRRIQAIVGRELGRAGIGRIRLPDEAESGPERIRGGCHHMGTTRMAADPRAGVVDAHCRVHECANLYVAGSSVFPTAGASNPTLTIVALAVRLARRIEHVLA